MRTAVRGATGALLASLIVGAAVISLAAQEPPPPSPGLGARPNVTAGELQELFDSYVLMQAQRQLRLSDAQLPQFVLRLKALQTARRRAAVQRFRAVQDLRRLTQPNIERIDEAQVRERLRTLDDLEAQAGTEIKQAQSSLDQILDIGQQARFRVLEEQMERNKVELMMRARQQANRLRDR